MNIFESPFSKNTCGLLDIPDGKSGGIQLMMVDKNNQSCNVKFLHDKETTVDAGTSFTTVSEKVSCSLSVNKFVLYLDKPSSYSWILENSITINIYNFRNNALIATKVIGKQDSLVRLGTTKYKDKPSIVLSKCDPDIDFNLDGNFVKVEIISMCDGNASPCCDSLPTQVAVSGYSNLCIPMNDFYTVPNYPPPTTTPKPYSAPLPTVSLLDNLSVKESSGIPYYVVDAYVSTSDGSDFSYYWERSEDNVKWYRITDLETEHTETLLALKEIKEKDYYYRLYFDSPQRTRSNIAFYNYPELVTTTTPTPTTPAPLVHPNPPTSVAASGGGFRQVFLSWKPPVAEDVRAPVSGYMILANTADSTSAYATSLFSSGVSASTTGYFQPVEQAYDGITLHYCVSAANFFGFSEVACDSATTISTEPPTVSNLVVTPDDTDGIEGFFLNWDTGGVNEVYPLVSHKIRHRTSGTADTYSVINYPVAELPHTQVKVTGLFDDCEQIEFLVDAESTIGLSTVPATGYGLYGFLPHSPTNISLALQDAEGGLVSIDLGWTEPTDSGRCDIDNYVYNYRLAGTLDWSVDVVIPATGSTMSIQTNAVPSGDYEARIAAITVVGTGSYGAISAATLVKLDFEDWTQNSTFDYNYHIENKSLYNRYADILTADPDYDGVVDGTNTSDALYGRSVAKFGNYGFYGSDLEFACPKTGWSDDTGSGSTFPYKIIHMNFNGATKSLGSPQAESTNNTKITLTNSSTRLNNDSDGETRSTMECWFKINDPDTSFILSSTTTNIGIMGCVSEIDPKQFNTSNYPTLLGNFDDGNFVGGYGEGYEKSIDLGGDFIFGSGLRLKLIHRFDQEWENVGGDRLTLNSSPTTLNAPHPNYISDSEWHHLAVVSSGNNLQLYVDGTGIINQDYTTSVRIDYAADGSTFGPTVTGIDIPSYFTDLIAGDSTGNGIFAWGNGGSYDASAHCYHLDEIRLSKIVAYTGNFPVPTEPLI